MVPPFRVRNGDLAGGRKRVIRAVMFLVRSAKLNQRSDPLGGTGNTHMVALPVPREAMGFLSFVSQECSARRVLVHLKDAKSLNFREK